MYGEVLEYYVSQSTYSDPGKYSKLYDILPESLPELAKILRGIIMPFDQIEKVPEDRQKEMNARYVEEILERIMELSDQPLTDQRLSDRRFLGCCRDQALLLCSIFRMRGIPARLRSGFAPYINIGAPGFNPEHVVAEVWDYELGRWRMVDQGQSEELIKVNSINFDVTDIPSNKFLVAGEVWIGYRNGSLDPDMYGVEPDSSFKGASMVKNRLIQDFHMLNKHELLIWDATPFMDLHIEPTEEELSLLDIVADVCVNQTDNLRVIRGLYQSEPKLQVLKVVSSYCPFDAPRAITLKNA